MTSPSEKLRRCSWQVVVCSGPCGRPLMTVLHAENLAFDYVHPVQRSYA